MMDFLADVARALGTTLKLGEYYVADWLYLTVLVVAVCCLYRGHRNEKINLWELVTAKDREGNQRTDGGKLFETGAFVVTAVGFSHMALQGKLTEWYVAAFLAAWVGNRFRRDREQRLGRALELEHADKRVPSAS